MTVPCWIVACIDGPRIIDGPETAAEAMEAARKAGFRPREVLGRSRQLETLAETLIDDLLKEVQDAARHHRD